MNYKFPKKKTEITVRTWGKNGWTKCPVKDSAKYTKKTNITRDETNWNGPRGEMDLVQDVYNEIIYGPIGLQIDELPGPLKDMFQQPSTWHIVNTRLFKILDEETQLQINGDWGADKDDEDIDAFEKTTSTSRLFLEQSNILSSDASVDEVIDILGTTTDGSEISDSPYGQRIDIDIQHVSIVPETSNNIISNKDDIEEIESTSDEDDVVLYQSKNKVTTFIPQLPKEAISAIRLIHEEFITLFKKTNNVNEQEFLKLKYEQALDREINRYITCSLNSPYCGHRYSQPRRIHQFIATPKDSEISLAAEERLEFFYQLFSEASSCDSMNDLHGLLTIDTRIQIEKLPNPNYGRKHRPGGFMGKIRGMYQHDKELAQEWSIYNRTDKDNNIIQKSAFNIAKEEFIQHWRENEKGDEETLRIATWVWFDREAKQVNAVYDKKTNQLVSSSYRYKDSIWRQRRTKALQDLFLTRKQWDAIYAMVDIIKKRFKLQKEPTQDRNNVLERLAEYFRRITNLGDLNSYTKWAQHRTVTKTGKVYPSRIDRISFSDEAKWLKSCAKKRRYLTDRMVLFNNLREQIKSSKLTNLKEQFLCCLDPVCNCMAIGQPEWFEIEDNKGLLGIKCDGCGKVVWCLKHRQNITLQTFEEAIKLD